MENQDNKDQTEVKQVDLNVAISRSLKETFGDLAFWNNETYKEYKNCALNEYMRPAAKFYTELPGNLTTIQKDYILDIGSFNSRMMILGIGLTGVALATYKLQPGIKRTIRNMTFAYFGFGLVIAPEVYNPFLASNTQ